MTVQAAHDECFGLQLPDAHSIGSSMRHGDNSGFLHESELAHEVEQFWRDRGFRCGAVVVTAHHSPSIDKCLYGIRSNLVNGLPPGVADGVAVFRAGG